MIYIIIGIVFIIAAIWVNMYFNEKTLQKRTYYRIKNSWGKISQTEYTDERFDAITKYYESIKKEHIDVDDITWNDIDMDTIYMMLNQTGCSMGEEYLYALLRQVNTNKEEMEERERVISFFQKEEKKRTLLQCAIRRMGKLKTISLYRYINRTNEIKKHNPLPHYCMAASIPVSLLLILFYQQLHLPVTVGIIALVGCLINNMIQYYKRKAEIEKFFSFFGYILGLLKCADDITHIDIPELDGYLDELKHISNKFKKFRRGAFLVIIKTEDNAGGFADFVLDYLRILFHIDLIKFDSMLSELRKNQDLLNRMYQNIGFLDSMIAIASFRTYLEGDYCIPDIERDSRASIYMEDAYHPMIAAPVKNTIQSNRCVLITGSNASGKSTFIKTIALNVILSQTIHTAMCSKYKCSQFKVYSSMALRDNLLGNDSYYIVEIKSLKRILDQIEEEIPTLCFVDEVLRGTNTLERIAASSQILKSFAGKNALCFAATHDIELTHILENHYENYHFQEEIKDNQVLFNYQLHKGRAVSRNAIKLLAMLGYDESIIKNAEKSAGEFLETGSWKVL